jgi:carbon monoxide dehydrogenase subunit G
MRYSASTLVPTDAETVHAVLTDVGHLAIWNPAFSSIEASGPAEAGRAYHAVVRGIAPVTLTFHELEPGDVSYTLRGLGSTERGRWISRPAPGGTEVTHSFEHSGLLLMLMHNAFVSVAEWRLGRLCEQALKATPKKESQP